MTQVAAQVPETAHVGDGSTTSFLIGFDVPTNSTVQALVDDVGQTPGVDFNVVGSSIVFVVAPTAGVPIAFYRVTAVSQTREFPTQPTMRPLSVEGALNERAVVDQEIAARGERAVRVAIGETPLQMPRAAARRGGIAFFADTDGAPLTVLDRAALGGVGDIENALLEFSQPEAFGSAASDYGRVQAAVALSRETRLTGEYVVDAAIEVPDDRTVSGMGGTISADLSHDDKSLMRGLAGLTLVGPLTFDGADLTAPTGAWFELEPIGGGLFVTGTDENNRVGGTSIGDGVVFKNTPSGAIYESFTDGGLWGAVRFENVQTYTGAATSPGVGLRYVSNRRHLSLTFDGYTRKALDLAYCENLRFEEVVSLGGVPGHSSIHAVGGSDLFFDLHYHRGQGAVRSYGSKFWATLNFHISLCDYKFIDGGVQFYGADGEVDKIRARDSTGAVILADSHGAAGQAGAVTRCRVGELDFEGLAATTNVDITGLTIWPDPPGDCLTELVKVGHKGGARVRKSCFGARSITVGGKTDVVYLPDWDVGELGSSGYPFYLEAKTIVLVRPRFSVGCNNGAIFFTNSVSRGGELRIEDAIVEPGAVTTSEPVIRVGYPSLFEAGFARILIHGLSGDLNGAALAKLISIHADTLDVLELLEIDGLNVTNAAAAEQVLLAMNAAATAKPVLNLGRGSVTDANGAQLGCTITGGAAIEAGNISADWLLPITGRPPKATFNQPNTVASGVTAFAGGGQASAVAVTTKHVRVATVATIGDSLKLPAALPGGEHIIANRGANALQLFGIGTDTVNGVAAATGISVAADAIAHAVCIESGKWEVRA